MQQRDYILRLIEMAGAVLREALRRVLGGAASEEEIHAAIGQAGARVGIDARLALLATPETLEMMVAPTGEVDLTRCWVLAESLFVAGAHAEASGDAARARQYFEKARRLFILLDPSLVVVGLPEAAQRVREIDERLSASQGPDPAA